MQDPASALASRIANRVLGGERWAREALARHAGRTFRLTVGPVAAGFSIAGDGALEAGPRPAPIPDLELVLAPWNVPPLLADPARWSRLVAATGDQALATTLQELAQTFPWFVERAFASLLGPIVGQRIADAGRALLAFPEYASTRIGENVGSYLRDEAPWLASGAELHSLEAESASVALRIDALCERVDRIAAAVDARGPRAVS